LDPRIIVLMNNLTVSVVIGTFSFDRLPDIVAAVESISAQAYRNYEIVLSVADNEELASALRDRFNESILVVNNTQGRGPSRTRNNGARAAKGDIVAFLDDDAVAAPTWLANLVRHYDDPLVMAAGGKSIPLWESPPPQWFCEELYWVVGCTYSGHPVKKTTIRSLPGCNMSFRRTVFERIGYFDENLGRAGNLIGSEDTEFFLRLRDRIAGAKIIFDPEVVVYHKVPAARVNVRYLFWRSYGEGLGKAYFSMLHKKALATEQTYLKHLLFNRIPAHMLYAMQGHSISGNIKATGADILSIIALGSGFTRNKMQLIFAKRRSNPV